MGIGLEVIATICKTFSMVTLFGEHTVEVSFLVLDIALRFGFGFNFVLTMLSYFIVEIFISASQNHATAIFGSLIYLIDPIEAITTDSNVIATKLLNLFLMVRGNLNSNFGSNLSFQEITEESDVN